MSCSLKFTLIVIFFYCWLSSSHEELKRGTSKSFDLRTVIMLVIAGGILAALLLLIVAVLCLYFKIYNALKAAKDPEAVAVKNHNPDKVWWAKNSQADTIATESCPALQCCEGCRMCASFDALPPCCCDINEGL
ncbi:PREDICTED: protein FAM24B isoform X2 [Rhinopithecus bieti]|uniref:protein FAM24B isoform X2 n=1 Tax=Rhinopithecus bieti TaxID=61621 RepID=UPI00083C5ADE|nr:PREDICTED: protein FAM24B isoform X2 [Rhinopithecus bieti]